MKKLLLVTTPLLLGACTHVVPTMPVQMPARPTQPAHATLPTETARQGQYIALPGQAAVDTDAAFDQQVAAYGNTTAVTSPAPSVVAPTVVPAPVSNGAGVIVNPAQTSAANAVVQPVTSQVNQAFDAVAGGAAAMGGDVLGLVPSTDPAPAGGLVDYTLRITNATPGRVFIEAQDAAGEIYPCGFMTGSQSISSEKKQVAPIKGPITVVVRDPDKPDAPELRRYKVTPPTGYAGKTVEITIISGGLYQVSVDGQVRYITPTPVGKPDLGNAASTPVTPATPAASGAAAPVPTGPAPEQEPAGM